MSALGDIVHALPVLAALRRAYPDAQIDWLADQRYAGVLDLVDGITQRIIGRPHMLRAIRQMRARAYDVAIDLQGLIKSAAMARFSGARRVIGLKRHMSFRRIFPCCRCSGSRRPTLTFPSVCLLRR
jgi:heptosyltransferase I